MSVVELERPATGAEHAPERAVRWRNLYILKDRSSLPGLWIHPSRAVAKRYADEHLREVREWLAAGGWLPPSHVALHAMQIPEPEWPFFF